MAVVTFLVIFLVAHWDHDKLFKERFVKLSYQQVAGAMLVRAVTFVRVCNLCPFYVRFFVWQLGVALGFTVAGLLGSLPDLGVLDRIFNEEVLGFLESLPEGSVTSITTVSLFFLIKSPKSKEAASDGVRFAAVYDKARRFYLEKCVMLGQRNEGITNLVVAIEDQLRRHFPSKEDRESFVHKVGRAYGKSSTARPHEILHEFLRESGFPKVYFMLKRDGKGEFRWDYRGGVALKAKPDVSGAAGAKTYAKSFSSRDYFDVVELRFTDPVALGPARITAISGRDLPDRGISARLSSHAASIDTADMKKLGDFITTIIVNGRR